MTAQALERLVPMLIDASSSLRGILNDWDSLDHELQEHYTLETEWLLRAVRQQIRVRLGDASAREALLAAEAACKTLAALADEIERAMGFRPEAILSLDLIRAAVSPKNPQWRVIVATSAGSPAIMAAHTGWKTITCDVPLSRKPNSSPITVVATGS